MKSITSIFPRASKSFLEANPLSSPTIHALDAVAVNVAPRRGQMNKTEAEFAMILEAMKRKGEILRYEFEGITLRFANVKYTPDFVVIEELYHRKQEYYFLANPIEKDYIRMKFIEVKGPFIKGNRERAVERFRHAKTYWEEFTFEMHQKTKEGWKQII